MASVVVTLAGRTCHGGGAGGGQLGRFGDRPRVRAAVGHAPGSAAPVECRRPALGGRRRTAADARDPTDEHDDRRRRHRRAVEHGQRSAGSPSRRTTGWRARSGRHTCSSTATPIFGLATGRVALVESEPGLRPRSGVADRRSQRLVRRRRRRVRDRLHRRRAHRPHASARCPPTATCARAPIAGCRLRRLPAVELFGDPAAMRAWSQAQRAGGGRSRSCRRWARCTPGTSHWSRRRGGGPTAVIVSIFVNPIQFDRASDFDRYPRAIDDDLAACRAAGVDAVYAPTAATMYPPGFQTRVVPGALADSLEGEMRPGHFEGVTTVVTKLLAATVPDVAMFGQKDYQQLAIVRRMVADLDLGVEIVGGADVARARRARPLESQRSTLGRRPCGRGRDPRRAEGGGRRATPTASGRRPVARDRPRAHRARAAGEGRVRRRRRRLHARAAGHGRPSRPSS